ncbi:TauD/TfdA family dioxygenase [Novosphingobium sp. 9U]|uniref:TauD/TfdA dioxygenase family protein n=1 Tax=Novosphingobium sp. 9U TaxID=2653158 RepID=UPI0012F146AC|nr:TauD/TfdA family dioxygenase [Novosphingobium sp. 9U]VWX47279.1 Putative taurine catabolism dioxygenase [Novosphingobium sp. 9U]
MKLNYEVLKPTIGARVELSRDQIGDPQVAQDLLELLEQHTVLAFPQVNFTNDEQLALTDALGSRVNIAASIAGRENSDEVYEVTLNEGAKIEKEYVLGTFFWHMDGLTVDLTPPKATVLSARRLSPTGGQTEFASTKAAYAALSEEEKAELQDLRVLHTVTASLREILSEEEVDPVRRTLRHEHPLVWRRADGTTSMVLGSTADLIIGKSKAESRAILARLLEWTVQPAFTYRHNWQDGDCVVWDNTSALHRVVPYAQDSGRMMHRTTIAGVEAVH